MTSPPPRLTRIVIRDLFRSHTVDIPMHREDRVTVLHGRNGSGKTVALTLINALFRQDYNALCRYPFSSLEVQWEDGSTVAVGQYDEPAHDGGRAPMRGQVALPLTLWVTSAGGGATVRLGVTQNDVRSGTAGGGGSLRGYQLLIEGPGAGPGPEAIKLASELLARRRVVFIQTQRLLRIQSRAAPTSGDVRVIPMVSELASEMGVRISRISRQYVTISGSLDGSLASRVLRPEARGAIRTLDDLRKQSKRLEDERDRLRSIGLLDEATEASPLAAAGADLSRLESHDLRILAIILDDHEEKLTVFKELADPAELMLDLLNRKFTPKRIKLHKDKGYEVTSHDGRPLKLDQLSSGEQHELVLLHRLLFDVPEGTLLLIDEPELSLHVAWQVDFLPDLIRVAEMAGFDAILATHSPYIAGDRRDLLVQLGEPVGARA